MRLPWPLDIHGKKLSFHRNIASKNVLCVTALSEYFADIGPTPLPMLSSANIILPSDEIAMRHQSFKNVKISMEEEEEEKNNSLH